MMQLFDVGASKLPNSIKCFESSLTPSNTGYYFWYFTHWFWTINVWFNWTIQTFI